ncbi:MAG: HU family DNA-binding protein [Prevotella sp.]|nr:HU family DNA-binding protein [Prevotella sp.]MBQ9236857.1 HU family DNA-binding protein [Prevotella sp.]MBR1839557.1 HU family DNA-binding protein [Prevotella sp.]
MILQLKKGTHPRVSSYGKYVARVMHFNTITPEDLEREIEHNCSATAADVQLVTRQLYATIIRHLQDGDRVEIPNMGTMKLEVKSKAVDEAKDFDPARHISSYNLHFIPKSKQGKPELYQGIKIDRIIRDGKL